MHQVEMKQYPFVPPLTAQTTIPPVFENVFEEMSIQALRLWKLNVDINDLAQDFEQRLNVSTAGTKRVVIAAHVR